MTDRPEFRIREAATACGVSPRTIRRRLDADAFPNAHRLDGPVGEASGPWVIPIEDLLAADLQPGKPSPPDAAPTPQTPPTIEADPVELEIMKPENADPRRGVEVAEAIAQKRERSVATQAQALRMLEAAPRTPADPAEATGRPRRWFSRRWSTTVAVVLLVAACGGDKGTADEVSAAVEATVEAITAQTPTSPPTPTTVEPTATPIPLPTSTGPTPPPPTPTADVDADWEIIRRFQAEWNTHLGGDMEAVDAWEFLAYQADHVWPPDTYDANAMLCRFLTGGNAWRPADPNDERLRRITDPAGLSGLSIFLSDPIPAPGMYATMQSHNGTFSAYRQLDHVYSVTVRSGESDSVSVQIRALIVNDPSPKVYLSIYVPDECWPDS